MKRLHRLKTAACAALLSLAFESGLRAATITSFDDIAFWTGSGENRAALVIDWKDGLEPVSLAWGFRWSGTATGEDMFRAVADADPRLTLTTYSFSFGEAVIRITYDLDGLPGISAADHDQDAEFDSESEMFVAGYSEYWIADGTSSLPDSWTSPQTFGFSDRTLSNNGWDGWSWAPDFESSGSPAIPMAAPVPEPATLVLILCAGGALLLHGRRKKS